VDSRGAVPGGNQPSHASLWHRSRRPAEKQGSLSVCDRGCSRVDFHSTLHTRGREERHFSAGSLSRWPRACGPRQKSTRTAAGVPPPHRVPTPIFFSDGLLATPVPPPPTRHRRHAAVFSGPAGASDVVPCTCTVNVRQPETATEKTIRAPSLQ
jgi:hypothetical protein